MEMAVLSSLSSKEILAHLAKWSIRPSRGDQYGLLWDLASQDVIGLTVLYKLFLSNVESHWKRIIYKRTTFALVNLRDKEGIPRDL